MKQNKSQSGSVHLIIIIVLVVALLSAVGYIFWQNFSKTDTDDANTDTSTTNTTIATITTVTTVAAPAVAPGTVVNDFLTSFFSWMAVQGNSVATLVSSSTALTDSYKDSIINPTGLVLGSPITLTQDFPSGFTIDSVVETGSSAKVSASMLFGSNKYQNVYTLVLVGNEWKIDSVVRA